MVSILLKTSPQKVADDKPHITKLRLNYSFRSLRNGILNRSIGNLLISTRWVICLTQPCHPLKESNFTLTDPLFLHSITSLFSLPSAVKVIHFVQFLEAPFSLLHWMLPNSNLFLLR